MLNHISGDVAVAPAPLVDGSEIPYGFCHCGCGGKPNIAKQPCAKRGIRKGMPYHFLVNHDKKKMNAPLPFGVLVDEADLSILSSGAWYIGNHGYVRRDTCINGKRVRLLMHRVIMNAPDGMEVDHINGCRTDNRRSNLRIVSSLVQRQNLKERREDNTSGYRGVTWDKVNKKWRAQGGLSGKMYSLGRFSDKQEAHEVVVAWRKANMPGYIDWRT